MKRHPETASQSEPEFWDGFSAWGDVDAGHGRLQSDRHRICIGLKLCAENPRICFANTHRLRPAAAALARGLQTLRVCLTPAPCIEFDSPRFGGSVGAGHDRLKPHRHRIYIGLRLCAENPRICFANTHRLRPAAAALARGLQTLRVCLTPAPCIEFDSPRFGGSVGAGHDRLKPHRHRIYIGLRLCAENPRICFANTHRLRPPAGVLARGLKTLTRFLNARALHRVRFSAVRAGNKKAGRYEYLPACYLWWRRGESNSGPRKPPDWHLQAQSLVSSRTLCAQRHARGVLTGSILARAIPITCAGAFP